MSLPDGGVGDRRSALDLTSLKVIRPLGERRTHFFGPNYRDVGPNTMGWIPGWGGMEKSISRDFSTNKISWQKPLTSLIDSQSGLRKTLHHGSDMGMGWSIGLKPMT